MDTYPDGRRRVNGNGGPANLAENFRAENAVKVHARLCDLPAGINQIADLGLCFFDAVGLTPAECLLRMMVGDKMADPRALAALMVADPELSRGAGPVSTMQWLDNGITYGTTELLHCIGNHDLRNPEQYDEHRALEKNLLSEIEQGLKSKKYDYFLFIRGNSDEEYMLVHAVDVDAGTMTYRALPSGVCETKAPFLRQRIMGSGEMHDWYQDWALFGIKCLPDAGIANLASRMIAVANNAGPSAALRSRQAEKIRVAGPNAPLRAAYSYTAPMDTYPDGSRRVNGNGGPANLAENFRAQDAVAVHARLDDVPAGIRRIADFNLYFFKTLGLHPVESLLRMAVADKTVDPRAIVALFVQEPGFGSIANPSSIMNWMDKGTPYGTTELLHSIRNHDLRDPEQFDKHRALEANLLAEIEQGLKSKKYDYFLFARGTHGKEYMLVHAVNVEAGTMTYRALPSGVCETKAPFKRKWIDNAPALGTYVPNAFAQDLYEDWALFGIKCLPDAGMVNIASGALSNIAPSDPDENFRAESAVEILADLSSARRGMHRTTNANKVFLKWERLTEPECLFRMMVSDGKEDDEEITNLLFKEPLLKRANIPLTLEWLEKGIPYGMTEVLYNISNRDQRDPAIIRSNREIEQTLLIQIELALKNKKYDCFLFMKEGSFVEYRLVEAASARAGTMTSRSLPSGLYEERAPFTRLSVPGHAGTFDVHEDWVLIGVKLLPKNSPVVLPAKPKENWQIGSDIMRKDLGQHLQKPVMGGLWGNWQKDMEDLQKNLDRGLTKNLQDDAEPYRDGTLTKLQQEMLDNGLVNKALFDRISALERTAATKRPRVRPPLPSHAALEAQASSSAAQPVVIENFRALHAVKVHGSFSGQSAGFHNIPGLGMNFLTSDSLSSPECLLRMAVTDGQVDESERLKLSLQTPTLGMKPTHIQTVLWMEKNPYGKAELVHEIANLGTMDEEIIANNRAVERNLLSEIEQGLKDKKYDYYLFFRGTPFREFMLVHAADAKAGTMTYRLLPSAVCETSAPFKQQVMPNGERIDQHDDWVLYGFKNLPQDGGQNQ